MLPYLVRKGNISNTVWYFVEVNHRNPDKHLEIHFPDAQQNQISVYFLSYAAFQA